MNNRVMFTAPHEAVGVAQNNGWMDASVLRKCLKLRTDTDLEVILYARKNPSANRLQSCLD